jgi:hypothetical protein
MKKGILLFLSLVLILASSPTYFVHAESSGTNERDNGEMKKEDVHMGGEQQKSTVSTEEKDSHSTDQKIVEDNASSTENNNEDNGEITGEGHHAAIGHLLKSLDKIAEQNDDIGDEVRKVEKEQGSVASSTSEAIDRVANRAALVTFLLGSDYESLGNLRSSIATTNASISQLEALRDKATTDTAKTELDTQITVLKTQQAKLTAYVDAHENAFSLFGWLVKLFGTK